MKKVRDPDTVRLFQYGSNMNRECFLRRIEENYHFAPPRTPVLATLMGAARLDGWRLRANLWSATWARRVVNIVKEDGSEVWGALYEIAADLVTRSDGKRSLVDRLEGHRTTQDPENYKKICITVDPDGESSKAWTYIGLPEAIDRCERDHPGTTCDPTYADTVIAGAKTTGVPDHYLEVLRKVLRRDSLGTP